MILAAPPRGACLRRYRSSPGRCAPPATTLPVVTDGDVCTHSPSLPLRFLIEGPPKIGKTTVIGRLASLLREQHMLVGGIVTHERRQHGRRVGFVVHDLAGSEAVLAHEDFRTGVRVGHFGVDVPAFERVALPALRQAQERGGVVIIDELGRMELASAPFVAAVRDVLTESSPVVATVHVHEHPITDALKQRTDVRRIVVTEANREELPHRLLGQLMRSVG